MSSKEEGTVIEKEDNVCRDFLRNVCRRGERCKYTHPADTAPEAIEGTAKLYMQDKMEFCHDFQNGRCHRTSCKFIHCSSEVEQEFRSSGYLPPSVRDQVINKGVAVDFPATNGGIPICKDFLKGKCNRDNRCKFRHVNAMEYDMEMNAYQNRRRSNPFGYGYFEEDDMMYERRGPGYSQERKRRCLTDMGGPIGSENSQMGPPQHAFQMVQEENHQLRIQIQELEKRVSDLTATNEFLLDQNAQLRMGVKSTPAVSGPPISRPSVSGPPPITIGHAQPGVFL